MSFIKSIIAKTAIKIFLLGVGLLLIALIMQMKLGTDFKIATDLILNLSTAILVSSIVSLFLETQAFILKINSLIESIVISKGFLRNLSTENKKQILGDLIKPSEQQILRYSNIEKYYDHFIKDTINVSKKNVRSNYKVTYKLDLDTNTGIIFADGSFSYRVYPSENGYTPIRIGFLKTDTLSKVEKICVYREDGERHNCNIDTLNFKETEDSRITEIDIQEFGTNFDHLDIEIKTKEYGKDHWMAVNFKALQPTDGFSFDLECRQDITIKQHFLFDVDHNFHIEQNQNDKSLSLACHQWINEGAGVVAIVSRPQEVDCAEEISLLLTHDAGTELSALPEHSVVVKC